MTLENQIELSLDQAKDFFDFLHIYGKSPEYLATHDGEAAEDTLPDVFRLIAAYGRKVREGKKVDQPVEITNPGILPTFIPRGNYFTIPQAAQLCNATPKQIRAWIRKGKLEAPDLPRVGFIIQTEKLQHSLLRSLK